MNGRRLCWLLLLGVLAALPAPRAAAQSADEPRNTVIQGELDLSRARARLAVLNQLKESLRAPDPADGSPNEQLKKVLHDAGLFDPSKAAWEKALGDAGAAVKGEAEAAETAWRQAAQAKLEAQARARQTADRLGLDSLADAPQPWPGGASRARLQLWSAVALAAGLLLAAYEGRHLLRQRARAASALGRLLTAAVLLGLMGLLGWWGWRQAEELRPAGLFFPTERGGQAEADALAAESARIAEVRNKTEAEIAALDAEIRGRRIAAVRAWAARLGFRPDEEAVLLRLTGDHFEPLQRLLADAHLARVLTEDARSKAEEAGAINKKTDDALERSSRVPWIRAAVALGVLFVACVPALLIRTLTRWQRRRHGGLCPRCLDGSRLVATGDAAGHVACQNPSCRYRFPAIYRGLKRLSLPTYGVFFSGKTHWLLATYFLIKHRNVPAPIVIDLVESDHSARVDAELAALHEQRQAPAATEFSEGHLPYPLLFRVADLDQAGVLLNLFDFSGEMARRNMDASPLRKRTLQMDGVIIVLDPTWPSDPDKRRNASAQGADLERFIAELRRLRGQPDGPLNVPVAVCLTKLDLIPTQSRLAEASLEWLDRLRETEREHVDLPTIRRRSELVRERLEDLFPASGIVKALEANFGNRYLFFPVTPVGLDDNETLLRLRAGRQNLEGRQMIPFGVAEPVLWLLHAHGYRVFE